RISGIHPYSRLVTTLGRADQSVVIDISRGTCPGEPDARDDGCRDSLPTHERLPRQSHLEVEFQEAHRVRLRRSLRAFPHRVGIACGNATIDTDIRSIARHDDAAGAIRRAEVVDLVDSNALAVR